VAASEADDGSARPVILLFAIAMLPPIVRLVRVPTLVSDEAVTPEFRVLPLRVPAAAVTVISAEPLKETPLMLRAVCRVVAVEALPVKAPVNVVAEMLPVPVMLLVPIARVPPIVRLVRVPTLVSADAVEVDVRNVPVEPAPDEAMVMPLIEVRLVGVALRPRVIPVVPPSQVVPEENARLLFVRPRAYVVLALIVIAAEPSKLTPLIARAVCNAVAVEAFPVRAPTNVVEVTEDRPVKVVTAEPLTATEVEPIVTLPPATAFQALPLKMYSAPLYVDI
jgi:hypothetical protein